MVIRSAYRLIIILALSAFSQHMQAGGPPDFATVDSVSYRLYLSRDWAALEKYGKEAMRSGIDYYYLRIRLGIASYEQHNYRGAITHFEKALSFSANDALASEYLYYAYLYAGYYEKARWLTRSFDSGFSEYLKTKKMQPIEFISAESGVKISDTSGRFKTALYSELALKHYIGRRMSLFHAVTYYQQHEFRFSVQQFQYYVNAVLPLKKGYTLSGSIHSLYYQAAVNSYSTETSTITHTAMPGGAPPPPPTQFTTTRLVQQIKGQLSYVGSVSILKQARHSDISLGSTLASLDTAVQVQLNAGLSYYPFGNNRLAVGSTVYFHSVNLSAGKVSVALAPFVSAVFTKKLSGSVGYFHNNGVNIAEQNGYLINNSPDFTTQRYTASISYALFKKMYIYAVCGRENKKELVRSFKYNYNIFIFGIKVVLS